VADELASAITVLDSGSLAVKKTIDLGPSPQRDFRIYGRFLFNNAGLTKGGRFTCNSCHPDGGTDGQNWQFAHVPDKVERRNTKDLRGELTVTAPYRWSGHGRELEEFIQDELTGLLGARPQPHDVLHSFWNLFSHLPEPENPYREANGAMTASARRGKALFDGKAGCGGCHEGEQRGGTGRKAWVGTIAAGLQLDVPHLHGVNGAAPYLHDGRAASLEDVFGAADPEKRHGRTRELKPGEMADLLRYVREL
jgi:cytochrome c peroxidase